MTRSRGSKDTLTRSLAVVLVPLFILSLMLPGIASATASVTAATGGSGISADTSSTGGTNAGTSLTGPTIVEGANRDIETGTIILQLPTGFAYKAGTISTSVTRIEGSSSCFVFSGSYVVAEDATSATFTVTARDPNTQSPKTRCQVEFSGIVVHPIAGSPLAEMGNITMSAGSTSTIVRVNGSTNFGSLTEVAGAAETLIVAEHTSPVTAGTAGSVTVTAEDAWGNTATSYLGTVHLTSSDPQAGLPPNHTFLAGENGVHAFTSGVTLKTAGTQSITATDTVTSSITGAQTGIVVKADTATKLAFTTQAGGGTHATVWGTQPRVTVQDQCGNTVTGSSASVTLAITGGTPATGGSGTLTCTTNPLSATSGVATFAGCKIATVGTGYSLTATSGSLAGATSNAFNS